MRRLWLASVSALIVLGIGSGCASTRWPWSQRPGTAQEQQRRAQKYDPYPATTVGGGPAMEGARPRDYDRPYSDTQRDYFQRVNPSWGVEGRPQEVGR